MSATYTPPPYTDRIDDLAIARIAKRLGVNSSDVRGLLAAARPITSHEEGILLWTVRCARDEQQLVANIRAAADATGLYVGEWIGNVMNPGAPQVARRWYA